MRPLGVGDHHLAVGAEDVAGQGLAPAGGVDPHDDRAGQRGGPQPEDVLGHVAEQHADVEGTGAGHRSDPRGAAGAGRDDLAPAPLLVLEAEARDGRRRPGPEELGHARRWSRAGRGDAAHGSDLHQQALHGAADASLDVPQLGLGGADPRGAEAGAGVEAHPLPDRGPVDRDGEIGVDERLEPKGSSAPTPLPKSEAAAARCHGVGTSPEDDRAPKAEPHRGGSRLLERA